MLNRPSKVSDDRGERVVCESVAIDPSLNRDGISTNLEEEGLSKGLLPHENTVNLMENV